MIKKILLSLALFVPYISYSKDINDSMINDIAQEIVEKYNINYNVVVLDKSIKADKNFLSAIGKNIQNDYYFASIYTESSSIDGNVAPGCTIFIDSNKAYQFQLIEKDSSFKNTSLAKDFTLYFLTAHELSHCIAQNSVKGAINEKYADFFTLYFLLNSEYKNLIPTWIDFLSKQKQSHNNAQYIKDKYIYIEKAKNLKDIIEIFKKYK